VFGGREHQLVKMSVVLTAIGFLPAVIGNLWGAYKTRLCLRSPVSPKEQEDHIAPSLIPVNTPAPIILLLPYALLTTSMSFFLFSFQVHEKTILLPLLPLTLLLSGATPGDEVYFWGVLGNVVGVFRYVLRKYHSLILSHKYSMWPLLKRDGLGVQYIATLLLWCRLVGHNPFRLRTDSFVGLLSTVRMHCTYG